MQEEDFLEDGDGLGHYPDGMKRTLTDEQIAIFRHSEIYAIIRQKQLRRENKDAGLEDEAANSVSDGRSVIEPEEHPAVSVNGALDSTMVILPLAPTAEEQVNGDDEEDYDIFLEAEREEMRTDAVQKKRKRNGRDTAGKSERAPTHRRLVRELDEVMVDDGLLDYGEEPAASTNPTKDSSQTGTSQTPYGRKPIVYDEEVAKPSVEAPDVHAGETMPKQGRKIWWPRIGS